MADDSTVDGQQAPELDARDHEAQQVLDEVCGAMSLDIRPEVRGHQGQYLEVELVGDDAMAAFGRSGKSLDSLQYLVNLIVGRRTGGEVRVLLDAAGYRARRAEVLTKLALEFAAQVKDRQEECELDPLPAHERRIVHNALLDDSAVRTYSEGDDPDRRVIIAPR